MCVAGEREKKRARWLEKVKVQAQRSNKRKERGMSGRRAKVIYKISVKKEP